MRKKLLAVLLAAAMLFSLAACDAAPTLYDVTFAEDGKLAVTEATAFDTDSPTPHEDKVLTEEELKEWLLKSDRHGYWQPYAEINGSLSLSTACQELGMQHLRRSPGGMYYSVFETETGGLFYLFFHNLMEYPYYQDHFKEEGWEPEHYFLMRWSFYVDQLYSFERFAHIAEGSPAEELYALCPWARGITHRFFILLTDGILAVTIAQEKIQALYYTDEFLLYEYSGDEAWIGEDYTPEEQGLTCDFRIWEFDLPKT